MNPHTLSVAGLALDMLGVSLIFFFGVMRARPAAVPALMRPADHGDNEAIALLGYFALMDGLLLQLIAALALSSSPRA